VLDNIEESPRKGDNFTETTKTNDDCGGLSTGSSENNLSGNKKWGSHKKTNYASETMSPEKTELLVSKIEQKAQRKLAHKIEDRCFEISKRVLDDIPLNTFRQLHMALAILNFVRSEFGIQNRFSECDEFIVDVYKISDFDYSHETELLREKYQKLYNMNFNARSNTSHDIMSMNNERLNLTEKKNVTKVPNNSFFGAKFESNCSSNKSESERSIMRVRQNSVILNEVTTLNPENIYYKKNPSTVNIQKNMTSIQNLDNEPSFNREIGSVNYIKPNKSNYERSCGQNVSDISSGNLEQQETVKTIKKLILNDQSDRSIRNRNDEPKRTVLSIDKMQFQFDKAKNPTLNCKFKSYLKDSTTGTNDRIIFNERLIKKPR